jgi:hypothetical protein
VESIERINSIVVGVYRWYRIFIPPDSLILDNRAENPLAKDDAETIPTEKTGRQALGKS